MILLSSYERARRYIGVNDDPVNKRLITQFLHSSSRNIQKYLGREFEKKSYTEYFKVFPNLVRYHVKAPPIQTLTAVENDSLGLFDGREQTVSDSFTDEQDRAVILGFDVVSGEKALRIIYDGGVAVHGTRSTFAITSQTGSFVNSNFVEGQTSGAVGIIRSSVFDSSIIIENLYGVFEVNEVIKESATEGGSPSGAEATILSITEQSFVEQFADIAEACEMQVRFDYKRKDSFEESGVEKENVTYFSPGQTHNSGVARIYGGLRPEVRSLLQSYRRLSFA